MIETQVADFIDDQHRVGVFGVGHREQRHVVAVSVGNDEHFHDSSFRTVVLIIPAVTVCVRLNSALIASAQSSTFNASKLFS